MSFFATRVWKPVGVLLFVLAVVAGSHAAGAERRRMALVIGNQAYAVAPLENPVKDAEAVARLLESKLGFQVALRRNLTRKELNREVQTFAQGLRPDDEVFVYYAGHGF